MNDDTKEDEIDEKALDEACEAHAQEKELFAQALRSPYGSLQQERDIKLSVKAGRQSLEKMTQADPALRAENKKAKETLGKAFSRPPGERTPLLRKYNSDTDDLRMKAHKALERYCKPPLTS